ncbi:MAG: hypothetical protein GY944_12510 [bacterium]|nr:hypothetical protein [bacterium]
MSEAEAERVGANPWAWLCVGLVVVAAALLESHSEAVVDFFVARSENPTLEEVERSIRNTSLHIGALLLAQSAVFLYLGVRQLQTARRASREGRFPPRATRLLLPIRVIRGKRCGQVVFYYRFLGACNILIALAALRAASSALP